jgi:hypothetical protein
MKALLPLLLVFILLLLPQAINAQVNSGSDGSDGALNPMANVVIDMADHPDGIYQYTSVNIPSGVTVSFAPNAKNTPVVWLVQGNCSIAGGVNTAGQSAIDSIGASAGPGGYRGGSNASNGLGPGGGATDGYGNGASYATSGAIYNVGLPAPTYGSIFLLPLVGGSGGGGGSSGAGGGGGGGAILIVASGSLTLNGNINASGGAGLTQFSINTSNRVGGGGSGGGIRIVASSISGTGAMLCGGGVGSSYNSPQPAGNGRVRFDTLDNRFGGSISGSFTQGFQPIILPVANQGVQLSIASIGGVAVTGSPGGVLANPDVIIPALQSNPINVVVNCTNVPLNTDIIIKVHPATGADVTATAKNTVGTNAASTTTIPVNMPRGGGIIYASAVTGIAGSASSMSAKDVPAKNIVQTGWTANGEKFVAMEITAGIGGKQRISYITDSGKRYAAPVN